MVPRQTPRATATFLKKAHHGINAYTACLFRLLTLAVDVQCIKYITTHAIASCTCVMSVTGGFMHDYLFWFQPFVLTFLAGWGVTGAR